MRVRDYAITLLAWGVLAWLLRDAVLLLVDWLRDPIFELTTQEAPDWERIGRRLAPFLASAGMLAAWLLFWALRRRHVLAMQFDPAQPPPFEADRQAAFFGMDPAEARRWPGLRVATIHFDEHGRPTHAQ
jgi:poly-beta-1,6-N-acetyl-D-glucosamine biosynthesis protein PgaD